jgi:hypothetical protein
LNRESAKEIPSCRFRAFRAFAGCLLLAACHRQPGQGPAEVPEASIGRCADPERGGVLGASPDLHRADRDLDGDKVAETVVADRSLCTREGNCYWNIYVRDPGAGCQRYVGTIAASVIDRLARRGDDGFRDLRGWWRLTGDSRVLLQEYRYHHGGYRVMDAMVCRQEGDDRLLCATDGH